MRISADQEYLNPSLELLRYNRTLRPLTHAPETGSRIGAVGLNSTPDSGASFSCPKAVKRARSRALARKSGAGIWRRIYGADFWSRFLESVSGP